MKKPFHLFEKVNDRRVANPVVLRILRFSMLVCGGLILMLAFFLLLIPTFKISKFSVTGNSYYSEEQLIAASGLKIGDELYGADLDAAAEKIFACPYVEQVQISTGFPGTVKIKVAETENVMYSSSAGVYFAFDDDFRVLKIGNDEAEFSDFIKVELPAVKEVFVGKTVGCVSEDLGEMKKVVAELDRQNLLSRVTAMNFCNTEEMSYDFLGKCRVLLGSSTSLSEKIALAEQTLLMKSFEGFSSLDVRDTVRSIYRENVVF